MQRDAARCELAPEAPISSELFAFSNVVVERKRPADASTIEVGVHFEYRPIRLHRDQPDASEPVTETIATLASG